MGKKRLWCVVCGQAHIKESTAGHRCVRQRPGHFGAYVVGTVEKGTPLSCHVRLPPAAHKDEVKEGTVGWTCGKWQQHANSNHHHDRVRGNTAWGAQVAHGAEELQREGGDRLRREVAATVTTAHRMCDDMCDEVERATAAVERALAE